MTKVGQGRNSQGAIIAGLTTPDATLTWIDMSSTGRESATDWNEIIAKALSFISLHVAELGGEDQGTQAEFYQRFGIPRSGIADLLGISQHQVRAVLSHARKSRNGTRHGRKGRKKR